MVRHTRLVGFAVSALICVLLAGPAYAGTCLGLDGSPGDIDGDGFPAAADCDDGNPELASTPGESEIVFVEKIGADVLLSWDPPSTGGPPDSYKVYRSNGPQQPWECLAGELTSTSSSDRSVPPPGETHWYIVQPANSCGDGDGGSSTPGQPRGPLVCDCSILCDDDDTCTEDICQAGACFNPLVEPTILTGPQDGAACSGGVANFSVVATGNGNLSYQWFINGNPAGQNAPVLVLSSLAPSDDGAQISVEVTDGCTSVLSASATLSVFADPASCAGGLDGFGAPNGASRPMALNRQSGKGGGAIYMHSGEYFRTESDLRIAGRGFDFAWIRTYRSREQLDSGHGHQWTHSYDRRVEQGPAGEIVLHDGSQGRADVYQPSPIQPNCWESPSFFRDLCLMPDNRYVLIFADKSEWIFRPIDPADGPEGDGLIEASVDRNGNSMFFGYDPTGRLEFIDDTLNRPIQIFYNPDGLIEAVTDFTGRAVTYDYYEDGDLGGSSGDLKSVTTPAVTGTPNGNDFPQGKTTTYTYTTGFADERLNHNLLAITDPLGQIFLTNTYAPTDIQSDLRFDRLDHTNLGGETYSYLYVQPPFDPALPQIVSRTYVNDRVGNVSSCDFDVESRMVRSTVFTGRAPDASLPTDGVRNGPVNPLRIDDPPSYVTVYTYNPSSLPVFIEYPRGNQLQLQYDSSNPNPRLRGNLVQRVRFPGLFGGSQPQISESWGYTTDYGTSYPVIDWSVPLRSGGGGSHGGNGGNVVGNASADHHSRSDSMSLYGGMLDNSSDDLSNSMPSESMYGGLTSDDTSLDLNESSSMSMTMRGSRGRSMSRAMLSRDHMSRMEMRRLSSDWDPGASAARGGGGGGGRIWIDLGTLEGSGPACGHGGAGGGGAGGTIRIKTSSLQGSGKLDGDGHAPCFGGSGDRDTTSDPGGAGGGGRIAIRAFPTSHTDGRGLNYGYLYNPSNGNLEQSDSPLVITGTFGGTPQVVRRTWLYNGSGQVTQYTNPAGRIDTFSYYTTFPQLGYLENFKIDEPGRALTTTFEYDPVGNVRFVTDPRGNTTETVYNQLDQPVRVVAAPPFVYERDLYYDANDNVVRIDVEDVDEDGVVSLNPYLSTTHVYDILDRTVRTQAEVGPGGSCVAEELEYDANSNLTLVRSGEATNDNDADNVVRYIFDERDLLFQTVRGEGSADSSTNQYDYDSNGNVRAIREGLEDPVAPDVTSPTYDGYDRLVQVVDPMGNQTTFDFDANHNVVERLVEGGSPQGSGTTLRLYEEDFVLDEVNRRVRSDVHHFDTGSGASIGDGFSTTDWFYDPDNRVSRVENDNGNAHSLIYDSVRRLSTVTDPLTNTTTYGYDGNSNVISVTELDRSGLGLADETFVTTYVYDSLNRRTRVIDNATFEWDYGYDSRDNLRLHTDSLDNVTRYAYDGMDRLIRKTVDLTADGTGATPTVDQILTEFCWDDASRLTCRSDDNLHETTYAYDALDRLTATTHADGTDDCLIWDIQSNPVERHDANGTVETRVFDELDRLVSNTVAPAVGIVGTTSESFQYDGLSRIVSATNDDSVVTHAYDSMSNVVEETLQIGQTPGRPVRAVSSEYDGVGNRTSLTYPTGRVVTTTYDALDRVQQVFSGGSVAATYTYIGPSRVERVDRPLGSSTDYEYDLRPLVTRVHTHDGTGSSLDDHTYLYDGMHNKVAETEQSPTGVTLEWDYDSAYRLVESGVTGLPGTTTTYTYDGVGNRTLVTGGADPGAYTQDPTVPPGDAQCNQYTTTPWDGRLYDDNGNLILATGPIGGPSYAYDYLDRMTLYTDGVGSTYDYKYDPYGRRVERADNGTGAVERFYYDGFENIVEEDHNDVVLRDRVLGRVLDELLESEEFQDVDFSGALDRHIFFRSEKDVTVAVDAATGLPIERYTYDDFGLPEFSDGAGSALPRSGIANPFLFTGRRHDDESGLYWFRTRYLDPRAGRFTSRDTIGGWSDGSNSGNAYTYVGNNPATFTDPLGQMNKGELVDAIAKDAGLSKADAKRALEALTSATTKALKKGDRISLIGFGSFSISKRAARTGRNPQTGKAIKIRAKKIAKFKAGKALADSVK